MYEAFYGLRERPFDLTPNPRFLVMTEGHREALSNLQYGIASRKGITLLIGDAGTGKTTIIRSALARQTSQITAVHISNPALTRTEFVEMMAARFNLSERARESKAVLLLELEALLKERRAAGETAVLIIDEAQSLSEELLEELRLLVNIETNEEKLLSLVIAGQPELAELLNKDSLRQLKQRIALRCELRPLTLQETLGYTAGRLRAAGGVASQIFTREAVTLLHEQSRGIPRALNVLADNALLGGFARNQRPVTRAAVAEVARDFHLEQPTAPVLDMETTPAGTVPSLTTVASVAAADGDRQTPADPVMGDPVTDSGDSQTTETAAGTDGSETVVGKRRRFSLLNRWGTA